MEKEAERKQAPNTQYAPTKCRVTKPVPPRPATNPLQFVAVKPSPLLIKAQEINKQVEIVKEARKERKEEAEDWQSNLDNWKSSRRKRQEHIIERVEEVKKLELRERERHCRRGTTFSEILEKRSKGRFSIPLYDNDANDLSDYGIGSSSSKTNSIKDVDTDDNSSILDDKENSCDEASSPTMAAPLRVRLQLQDDAVRAGDDGARTEVKLDAHVKREPPRQVAVAAAAADGEQYTYEGAIEDYRSRIRAKIHLGEPALEVRLAPYRSKECAEAQSLLPKGNLTERRRMFEAQLNGTAAPKHVEEDLLNAQSIKERLQSLEKCRGGEDALAGCVQSKLTQFAAAAAAVCDSDAKNSCNLAEAAAPPSQECAPEEEYLERRASASDLVAASSSDREDSGIHTADVSCSVSQSDEPVEDIQEAPNYRIITAAFLSSEREAAAAAMVEGAARAAALVEEHSPLVEHIAKTIQEAPGELGELDEDGRLMGFYDDEARVPFALESIDLFADPLAVPALQPPTEKPPPPPPPLADDNANRIGSPALRVKRELLLKRSSFLGLEEAAVNEQLEQLEAQERRRELSEQMLLQHEQELKRQLQFQEQAALAALPVNGADADIMQKEREIIALIEQEEKCKHHDDAGALRRNCPSHRHVGSGCGGNGDCDANANAHAPPPPAMMEPSDIYLGNKKFDEPFYPEPCYDSLSEQDSEVLRVEQELLQLEQEELKRQRDVQLFRERAAKLGHAASTYENMYYDRSADTRKSMPDLKSAPAGGGVEQRHVSQALSPPMHYQRSMPHAPHVHQLQPPLQQHAPTRMRAGRPDFGSAPLNYRKSMPDLDRGARAQPAFTPAAVNNNLLMPIQPLHPLEKMDRFVAPHPIESDAYKHSGRGMPRHSAPSQPRSRSMPREAWIQPKAKPQAKSYNQHWLYQEAELRRLADQQKAAALQSRPNHMHHAIDANALDPKRLASDMAAKRSGIDALSHKDYVNVPYLGRQPPQTYGRALPMTYPQPHAVENDVILSVSGKKKCSYCNSELGRGAAMIIESLSLFYHMECFKCCVCHIELGDGLMGTDVRVRNQKLHCHNCYSSDDGIKFSCV